MAKSTATKDKVSHYIRKDRLEAAVERFITEHVGEAISSDLHSKALYRLIKQGILINQRSVGK